MKKFIMLSALVAAVSTAFVACSSDDDLAQAPAVPEETVVDTPKGTPFSVLPSSNATRAVRYGSSAWDGTSDDYVTCFKLYGNQTDLSNVWVNNVVFTRTAKDADWQPTRDGSGAIDPESLKWPTDDTSTPLVKESEKSTDFYAITDNAIGVAPSNALDYVSSWMSTEGSFIYDLHTTHSSISWDDTGNPGDLVNEDVTYVDPTELRDLMYATTTKTEADVTNGQLPLAFHHALSGLSINAVFVSNSSYGESGHAVVKAVYVCGLNTHGKFTMDPDEGSGTWSEQSTPQNYYYELPESKTIYAEDNTATPTPTELVPVGQWLAIPQTTTPWNLGYNTGNLPDASTCAYIIVKLTDKPKPSKEFFLCYPLNTTLNPGKNRVITINIAEGRYAPFNFDDENLCDLFYQPSSVFGGSRQYEFDSEDF